MKNDLIRRQDVLHELEGCDYELKDWQRWKLKTMVRDMPSAQKVQLSEEDATSDLIRRQAAIDAVEFGITYAKAIDVNTGESKELFKEGNDALKKAVERLKELPSAEPERTCVNCGRTANNGGWYADGGTRCPIEEHYALPKDGFCHLWEKRNVTDDDYPERREE